ncbi:hypothetical protein GTP44_02870 [Duganella sp. FT50W]|uniref:T6SS Phospholipase effector Tle1-like catalytic domain-containing protein n=1 Tax=Duganella lactea TaxID=2692173 RepID=A0A6L8MEN9_9BURK|nr:DUF2235 domain-containing protein [Duganella lactea]MYM80904.1 hypothetical protein [Duganella lactea]
MMKSIVQTVSALVLLCQLLSGCASTVNAESHLASANTTQARNIFVFMDGTANESASGTNVYRTFKLISQDDNTATASIYIEGVATAGASAQQVLEAALGYGMQPRILTGYQFITDNYRAGDKVFIFGFSRGAHEARALAGLLSYAGIPKASPGSGKKILSLVKSKDDDDYLQQWKTWKSGDRPLLADEIKRTLNLEVQGVEVNFLGLWDTVPGSSLKKFGKCKEEKNSTDGDRYKSGSYPPIHYIAHAVSVDEKRSKFRPILLCDAINPELTTMVPRCARRCRRRLQRCARIVRYLVELDARQSAQRLHAQNSQNSLHRQRAGRRALVDGGSIRQLQKRV